MGADVYRRNIPKVCWLNFSWMFLLIQPVIVPFFQSRGLGMSQAFAVQTAFSLTLCLLDVPTGYLSDRLGRKFTLVLASALKGLGGVLLCFARGGLQLAGAYVVIGVGNSLYSGSDVALLYESAAALPEGQRPPATALFGRRVFYLLAGTTASALLGGLAAGQVSLDAVIIANAVCAWIPFLICLTLREAPRARALGGAHWENVGRLGRELFTQSRFVRAVVFAGVFYGAAPVLAVYLFQAYWTNARLPLPLFGLLTAAFSLAGALAGRLAHRLEGRLGAAGALALVGALPVVGLLGGAWLPVVLAVPCGAFLEMERGLAQALLTRHFNGRISSDLRATANSVVSFATRLLVAGAGPVLGWALDRWGAGPSLAVLGVFYLGVLLLTGLPLARGASAAAEAC